MEEGLDLVCLYGKQHRNRYITTLYIVLEILSFITCNYPDSPIQSHQ